MTLLHDLDGRILSRLCTCRRLQSVPAKLSKTGLKEHWHDGDAEVVEFWCVAEGDVDGCIGGIVTGLETELDSVGQRPRSAGSRRSIETTARSSALILVIVAAGGRVCELEVRGGEREEREKD